MEINRGVVKKQWIRLLSLYNEHFYQCMSHHVQLTFFSNVQVQLRFHHFRTLMLPHLRTNPPTLRLSLLSLANLPCLLPTLPRIVPLPHLLLTFPLSLPLTLLLPLPLSLLPTLPLTLLLSLPLSLLPTLPLTLLLSLLQILHPILLPTIAHLQ